MRNPKIIANMCCVPVPPINFALGNISKKTTYRITPDAIPEIERRIFFSVAFI